MRPTHLPHDNNIQYSIFKCDLQMMQNMLTFFSELENSAQPIKFGDSYLINTVLVSALQIETAVHQKKIFSSS